MTAASGDQCDRAELLVARAHVRDRIVVRRSTRPFAIRRSSTSADRDRAFVGDRIHASLPMRPSAVELVGVELDLAVEMRRERDPARARDRPRSCPEKAREIEIEPIARLDEKIAQRRILRRAVHSAASRALCFFERIVTISASLASTLARASPINGGASFQPSGDRRGHATRSASRPSRHRRRLSRKDARRSRRRSRRIRLQGRSEGNSGRAPAAVEEGSRRTAREDQGHRSPITSA